MLKPGQNVVKWLGPSGGTSDGVQCSTSAGTGAGAMSCQLGEYWGPSPLSHPPPKRIYGNGWKYMEIIGTFGIILEPRSKSIVDVKCAITVVSPLLFSKVSCFCIFFPLSKHSFEAHLLEPSSLGIFVCVHWGTYVAFARTCLPCGSSFALLG